MKAMMSLMHLDIPIFVLNNLLNRLKKRPTLITLYLFLLATMVSKEMREICFLEYLVIMD